MRRNYSSYKVALLAIACPSGASEDGFGVLAQGIDLVATEWLGLWCNEEKQGFLLFQVPNITPSLVFSYPCAMALDTYLQPQGDQLPTELTRVR